MEREELATALHDAAALGDDAAYVERIEALRGATSLRAVLSACELLTGHPDEDVRMAAVHLLGTEIGDHLAARRVEDLAVAASEADLDEVLEVVAVELGRLRSPDAVPTLRVMAAHRTAGVRQGAATGLGALLEADPGALEPLAYLAGDDDPRVRDRAVHALAASGLDTRAVRDVLAGALADDDLEVRFEAARGLGERGDERAIPAVLELWPLRFDFASLEAAVRRLAEVSGDPRLEPLLADL